MSGSVCVRPAVRIHTSLLRPCTPCLITQCCCQPKYLDYFQLSLEFLVQTVSPDVRLVEMTIPADQGEVTVHHNLDDIPQPGDAEDDLDLAIAEAIGLDQSNKVAKLQLAASGNSGRLL